ncbi:hypothetical protein [Mycetohabitans sp. B6]|uniref:Uncharacterized protein n=1 Tax=Mycetohabitans rhizoxinica TaxID=412963 RepID=A0ABZ2Q127_9BURK|nr:hypothetical protein [Mycetohabitans sp. B2]MCG1047497.1 hypothetical protein [Mycetohabitans sp. B6]
MACRERYPQLGTQRLTHSRGSHAIAISCAPTLASRWLLPLLPRLRQQRWAATVVAGFVAAMLHFPIDDATVDVPPRVVGAARA